MNESILKFGASFGAAIAVCLYPIVLLLVLLTKVYEVIFGKSKCKNIAGDIAVVTGGANGLGKEISIELAKQGCHIAVVDINLPEAEKTAELIQTTYKVKAKAYKVDVSNYDEVAALNEKVTNDLGIPTILINNAGILMFKDLLKPDVKEIQSMINVNLTSHFWTNRVFLPQMKQLKRGHIVAISSASSLFPLIGNAEYTSTKFAIRGLMRVLRQDLQVFNFRNIHATTVFPTFLQTNTAVVEVIKKSGFDKFYPLISGQAAARRIVEGMLHNEKEIVMPTFMAILYRLLEGLPAAWQDWLLVTPYIMVSRQFNKLKKVASK